MIRKHASGKINGFFKSFFFDKYEVVLIRVLKTFNGLIRFCFVF
jgi:hypothetical protein